MSELFKKWIVIVLLLIHAQGHAKQLELGVHPTPETVNSPIEHQLASREEDQYFTIKQDVALWPIVDLSDEQFIETHDSSMFEPDQIQKQLAEEYEQSLHDYSILNHKFYENESIRIFNYTAYNVQSIKNTFTATHEQQQVPATEPGLGISFGYGVELKLNPLNRIGYEYLSTFPYDRGQILRIYWNRILTN